MPISIYGFAVRYSIPGTTLRAFKIWLGSIKDSMLSEERWEELWREFQDA
jgi:hypothetical protein